MVVVCVFVSDADDAEPLRTQRTSSLVLSSIELRFDRHADVLSMHIAGNIVNLLAHQGPCAAASGLQLCRYHWVQVQLQPIHKVTVVLIDQWKSTVLEVRQIEQI